MDNNNNNIAPLQQAPATAAVAPPAFETPAVATPAAPAVAPVYAAPAPNFLDGFKGLNWIEVGFGILGSATLYYTIYYFKYKIQFNKQQKDIENRLDSITMDVSDLKDAQAAAEKSASSQPTGMFI